MKEKYMLLSTSGGCSVLEIDPKESLESMQAAVGGFIEIVSVGRLESSSLLFVVDDEGRMKNKPVNRLASPFYRGSAFGDPLVGDVLVGKSGFRDGEPDIVGLSAEDLENLSAYLELIGAAL